MFYNEVIKIAREELGINIDKIFIEQAQIGVFLTAVKLSTGSYGLAFTDSGNCLYQNKNERNYGDFSPTKITGRTLKELLSCDTPGSLLTSLKAAAINGLSTFMMKEKNFRIAVNSDTFDLINFNGKKKVTMVGGINSYIRRISDTNCELEVLELNENAIQPEHIKYYVPAEKANDAIPGSDVVIITGASLVNNTIEDLLQMPDPAATVVVVGPSAGIYPEVLFKRNVDLIGATRITNPEAVMSVVREGGTGYHLFRYGAEKVTIIRDDYEAKA